MPVPPRPGRVPLVLGLSIGAHVLLGFLILRMPVGQRLLERVIPVQMVEHHKPKPAPKQEKPRLKRPPVMHAVQPRPHPAPPSAQPSNSAQTFGMASGAGNGTMDVPTGQTLEAEASASGPVPLVLDASDDGGASIERTPTPIGSLRVAYPEIARLSGATGSAVVQAYVSADGLVERAELISASARIFGRAALEAVRESRFRPAVRAGVSVACTIRLPVRFELTGASVGAVEPSLATPSAALLTPEDARPASPSVDATGSLPVFASPAATGGPN